MPERSCLNPIPEIKRRLGGIGTTKLYDMVKRGVGTGATEDNIRHAESMLEGAAGLDGPQMQLLHDPQTSGGLLLVVPAESASALTSDLVDTGHDAADIGEVLGGPPCLEIV